MLCVTRNRFAAGRQRQAGVAREVLDDQPPVVVAGVEPGADRRRADVQLVQLLRRRRDIVARRGARTPRSR